MKRTVCILLECFLFCWKFIRKSVLDYFSLYKMTSKPTMFSCHLVGCSLIKPHTQPRVALLNWTSRFITSSNLLSALYVRSRLLFEIHKNIGTRGFITRKQKNSSNNMLPHWALNPGLWFQVQHYPFWTNLKFACKTETLGSLDFMLYYSNWII